MALVKALMIPLDQNGVPLKGEKFIPVMFNPNELTLDQSNQFQSTQIPGLATPVSQYVSGNPTTLQMELFFDTYELHTDVRLFTGLITKMLDINSEMHAPPICQFVFGTFIFRGIIEKASQKFTMFNEMGIPVRATVNVSMKEYKSVTDQLKEIPRYSSDRTKQWSVKQGESLSYIAGEEYGDPELWRSVAKKNGIINPRKLKAGTDIVIPPLE